MEVHGPGLWISLCEMHMNRWVVDQDSEGGIEGGEGGKGSKEWAFVETRVFQTTSSFFFRQVPCDNSSDLLISLKGSKITPRVCS